MSSPPWLQLPAPEDVPIGDDFACFPEAGELVECLIAQHIGKGHGSVGNVDQLSQVSAVFTLPGYTGKWVDEEPKASIGGVDFA